MSGLTGIHEVAAAAGVTSRTLRHYDDIGLLPQLMSAPTAIASTTRSPRCACTGSCCCALTGLSLSVIAEILAGQRDDVAALRSSGWLQTQKR